MTVPKALNLYGPADLDRIRGAKATLTNAPLVVPRTALPGCGRVLAWDDPPPWVAEYCLVNDVTTEEGLAAAIACVLGLREDPRMVSYEKSLSRLMGADCKEVWE